MLGKVRPDETQARKDWDMNFVSKLLIECLELDITYKMKHVIRLGRYEENSEQQHPRLIKVIFDNEDTARLVLRSANKIRNSQNGDIKEVKSFRDLSQSDREKRKLLVNEMKLKNEDLKGNNISDSKFIIRGDSVVKVKVDPSKTGQHF